MRTDERAKVIGQPCDDSRRSVFGARKDRFDHALEPKFVPLRVERFGDAVSVKNQAILALERQREVRRPSLEYMSSLNSKRHAGWIDSGNTFVRCAKEQGSVVAGAAKPDLTALSIENRVGH